MLPVTFALVSVGCGSSDKDGELGKVPTSTPEGDAAVDSRGAGRDDATNANHDGASGNRDSATFIDTANGNDANGGGDDARDGLTTMDARRTDVVNSDRATSDIDADRGGNDVAAPDTSSIDAPPNGTRDGSGGAGCADLPLCDDFERATAGSPPAAPTWSIVTPNCSGTSTAVIDDTQSHSGTKSVKVTGTGGYCNHIFFGATSPVAATGTHVFGRMYVRFASALGEAHVTFMAMRDSIENKDLRMGGQKSILMWNRESDDATLPELSPAGIALSVAPAVNTWKCVEFEVDGAAGTIATWVDGALVTGLVEDGMSTPDVDAAWLRKAGWKPTLSDVKFGWESYGDAAMTLWFDDIAVGARRVGCVD